MIVYLIFEIYIKINSDSLAHFDINLASYIIDLKTRIKNFAESNVFLNSFKGESTECIYDSNMYVTKKVYVVGCTIIIIYFH